MNESECASLLASVQWTDPTNLVSLAVLAFINVLVIVGNCLVIAAVLCSHKLRSVTNFFIVSLAVADLLVGLAVLPFSATWEVFKVWIFGDVWCRIWLAVDVWMCTASILNLCAISLDRYVAVTRPVTYPSIMSTRRAKSLIAGLWVLSFVICFPPLVGWKEQKVKENVYYQYGNYTLVSVTPSPAPPLPCPWTCELTNDAGYVVYSALGSFYIPMFVMLFFYWRIYRAAVRTTRAINQGFRTTKGMGNRFDDNRLTLRIHRGRGSTSAPLHESPHSNGSTHSTTTSIGSASPERLSRYSTRGKLVGHGGTAPHPTAHHEKIKISVSYPSTENVAQSCHAEAGGGGPSSPAVAAAAMATSSSSTGGGGSGSTKLLYAVHYSSANGRDSNASQIFRRPSKEQQMGSVLGGSTQYLTVSEQQQQQQQSHRERGSSFLSPRASKRMGKRNIKAQVKRFRMETKAAKTLAIIVGLFVLCWLPFFTMYLVRPFCDDCINELLFSIVFWIGYCNSAINPMIYALFSKDFRFAFKRIICRCFCSGGRFAGAVGSRRGSDMSQMRAHGGRTPSISPSAAAQSLCDDSDPVGGDLSDSR
ncbi:octopamine receptor Oamb isoform X1 [Anopheles merus]|uniref:octopamine receptor Oamb isoform X1 n=1 Tax=Anopheles merus TaxID=30066 RepID=UPI001BE4A877|nr:octopamine receptor Oamb isoform X1 [Anopheles merus]XP_041770867.1 octopamine receptor Oamb isoform X1 [Anopheles merus]XP_041770954.1 octopamine receptor Oamb isoform X1 [Anopheles merus]XP_041771033.1 octopamine receptor Oamb isoform X1 [Anopheles merus]XP_041771115.1 octopamine receptor Oamb isoform X1 [Anopheles merus]XP_041771196.1 octopamine receptor Oamb isoform X1 [Anopheles merus]XP_041771285.1 octopamine receptor Oamb isoform X1 [Anopheles merus]